MISKLRNVVILVSNKQQIAQDFISKFNILTETEKERFSRVCNKLLDKNFLIRQKQNDKDDYFFTLKYLSLFQSYFLLMDYSVTQYDSDQIISLGTEANRNRVRLKRIDTIMLLILRLLYQKKSKEVSQLNKVIISIGDIHDEIEKTSLFKGKIPKTELKTTLYRLKRYSLIDFYSSNLYSDKTKVEIYPSLLRVVNIEDMEKLERNINEYLTGGANDEDNDED